MLHGEQAFLSAKPKEKRMAGGIKDTVFVIRRNEYWRRRRSGGAFSDTMPGMKRVQEWKVVPKWSPGGVGVDKGAG